MFLKKKKKKFSIRKSPILCQRSFVDLIILNKSLHEYFFRMIAAFATDTRHIRSAISSAEEVKRETQERQ